MISFRVRLFVVASAIVGVALSAVLLVGWNRVLAFEVERLDERLCMEARRFTSQPSLGGNMSRLQNDLMAKLRLSTADQLMLKFEPLTNNYVRPSGGTRSAQSPNWSGDVALDGANWGPATRRQWDGMVNDRADRPDRPDRPPPNDRAEPPAREAAREPPERGECALGSFDAQDRQWRAARFTAASGRSVVATDLAATKSELQAAFAQALKIVVPLAVVLTALGAWLISVLTMRPVNRLRQAMTGVTQKALGARLPALGEDREFAVLMDAYNHMLERLETSFQQASRFSSDAAHELKTPLTILQGHIEQALQRAKQPTLQADLTILLDEVARLSDITRKLLLLSQADAGWLALHRVPIDLTTLLDEMALDTGMMLSGQVIRCEIARGLKVHADAVLLRQLLNNLISNAVRYCLPDGWIKLTAKSAPDGVEVVISNAAQAISQADRARFFDRFFRGDATHNRSIEGNGLGLSLSREIALAHGGSLVLLDSAPSEVTLRLTL